MYGSKEEKKEGNKHANMDGWMDGWVDGWMDVRTYICMYVCLYVCVYVCMYVCMYLCIYVLSMYYLCIIYVLSMYCLCIIYVLSMCYLCIIYVLSMYYVCIIYVSTYLMYLCLYVSMFMPHDLLVVVVVVVVVVLRVHVHSARLWTQKNTAFFGGHVATSKQQGRIVWQKRFCVQKWQLALGLSLLCYKVIACIRLNHQVWLNCSKFRDGSVVLLSHLGTTNFSSVSVMNYCTMSHMNFNIVPGWFSHHCVC